MKKIIVLSLSLLICVLLLASCGGPKLIGIIPRYVGEEVTDTQHEFKAEDFTVLANYDDGTNVEVDGFEFEVTDLSEGYYTIYFNYKGVENECYVRVNID